jgi:hypothetical protein
VAWAMQSKLLSSKVRKQCTRRSGKLRPHAPAARSVARPVAAPQPDVDEEEGSPIDFPEVHITQYLPRLRQEKFSEHYSFFLVLCGCVL